MPAAEHGAQHGVLVQREGAAGHRDALSAANVEPHNVAGLQVAVGHQRRPALEPLSVYKGEKRGKKEGKGNR